MSLRKIDFSSMKSILDEVNGEELYNVIGGCGVSGGSWSYSPTFPTGPQCPFH